MSSTDGKLIFAAIMAIIGLLGLYVASSAGSGSFYWFGLGVFVAAVVAVFVMIARTTPQQNEETD